MNQSYFESKTFSRTSFIQNPPEKGEYENCIFKDCDFSGCDLTGIVFMECSFEGCNLSLAKISNAAFQEIRFKTSKLLGLHFENCNTFLFSIDFDHCVLNLSSFYKLSLKRTKFRECSIQEVDFSETDLSGSSFDGCDLTGALFDNTNLEKTDFRTAVQYTIDPEKNRMKKARFSLAGVEGLLAKYGIQIEP